MRTFHRFRCEYGHEWTLIQNTGETISSNAKCAEGHDYITCQIEYPVDDVQILIIPAARIIDRLKNQRALNGKYYLSLLNNENLPLCQSADCYEWSDVLKLANFFQGKSPADALSWWLKRKL